MAIRIPHRESLHVCPTNRRNGSLPKSWPRTVKSAILHVISLAQFGLASTPAVGRPTASIGRIRFKAQRDQANDEAALLREQLRIVNARMARIPPQQRPHYPPTERLAILELKAARGWSLEQTAKAFLVTAATIASWMKRVDEDGPDALVQLRTPVNKFPDVRPLRRAAAKDCQPNTGQDEDRPGACPGRAALWDRPPSAGCSRSKPTFTPRPDAEPAADARIVTAKYPNHVWHVDLTVVPTAMGFWCSWFPLTLPQCWPFCWWVATVVDHFSRRVMGTAAFRCQPTSEAVRGFLGRTIAKVKATPKYIVCDRGGQFDCEGFRAWCRRKGIKPPRYGAIGQHGSIAVVERFILTMKCLLGLPGGRAVTTRCVPARASGHRAMVQRPPPAHLARRADARRSRTTGRIPPTAARDLNLAAAGHAVRHAPSRGRSSAASPACGSTWK